MTQLVLSLFPGIGMLDRSFEEEGFCVVRGPDVIWGGDVRTFRTPADRFDGIIGGDPCQSHSSLANLVRAKGLEPSFPDMTPEYQRVVEEARPAWFLRENTPKAPEIKPQGYAVHSFLLDNSTLDSGDGTGNEQMRKRRFWFGSRWSWMESRPFVHPYDKTPIDLRAHMDFALLEHPDPKQSATGRHAGEIGLTGGHRGSPGHYSLEEMCRLQGFTAEELFGKHSPLTMQGKRKAVGNGVPKTMGVQLARAIRAVTEEKQ